MRSSGLITVKRGCSISALPMSNASFCIRTIPTRHIHHKANSIGSGHTPADHDYLHAVAEAVSDAGAILITGPANAKTELVEHIRIHDPRLTKFIVGVETVDHPSDAQLVAHAKKYLVAADRMRPWKSPLVS